MATPLPQWLSETWHGGHGTNSIWSHARQTDPPSAHLIARVRPMFTLVPIGECVHTTARRPGHALVLLSCPCHGRSAPSFPRNSLTGHALAAVGWRGYALALWDKQCAPLPLEMAVVFLAPLYRRILLFSLYGHGYVGTKTWSKLFWGPKCAQFGLYNLAKTWLK